MKQKTRPHAPAVDRALDVIELMAASDRDLSLSELMKGTNIPRQTLIRILNTFCDRGVIDRSNQRGFYRLGMNLMYLGSRLQEKFSLRLVAWPVMNELAQQTRKTVELGTLDRDQLVLIERIEGTEGVRFYSRVGSVYPYFHAVAVGKIYLAHMESGKRRKVLDNIGLPAVTPDTQTDRKKLEREVKRIRKEGYAFEDQELRKGIRRVAAPIYDFRSELVGCISVAATILSFELKDKEVLGRMVMEAGKKISYEMGRREGTHTGEKP